MTNDPALTAKDSEIIKLAFTGTGNISKTHALAAQKLPGVQLTAIVNHRPESMTSFAAELEIPRQYASVEDLLRDGDVDAISINTPNYLHAPQSIAALDSGVHVIVEKPMAMNAREAQAMLEAGRKSGALLMVAHCWRFGEETQWLKTQIGRVGNIIRTMGYGVHVNWGPSGWFTQAKYAGGGALADMGIHAIDTTRFLLGDPQPISVYARIGAYYGNYDVDDTGLIMINWDDGVTSVIESGWWQPHCEAPEAGVRLFGRDGFASLYPTTLSIRDRDDGQIEHVDGGFPFPQPAHAVQTMYGNQMKHFIDSIRARQTPVPGGLEGLTNMKIVDAAYESARSGQVVHIE